jgi:precorrin-2 dehydrogenase/sirohydrochlorin ferrochelatase
MRTYPINLVGLQDTSAVVIGGGSVATRKVAGLLEVSAQVTVISPEPSPELVARSEAGTIRLQRRPWTPTDVDDAFLVVAATDDPAVNRAVALRVRARGGLVNVVDDPTLSTFILPAVLRRGDMTIAVSTGGASPALAAWLRRRLEATIGAEYAALTDALAALRPLLLAQPTPIRRQIEDDLIQALERDGAAAAFRWAQDILQELQSQMNPPRSNQLSKDTDETDG